MTKNITALLNSIKENIKAIEGGGPAASLLNEVQTDYVELLELIKLFLISERDIYYGYFLMNMQFRANFYTNSMAGIKLNSFPPIFEANPLLLCKLPLSKCKSLTLHQLFHGRQCSRSILVRFLLTRKVPERD